MKRLASILALVLPLAASVASARFSQNAASDEQVLSRGKEIYEARCKMCHRADGKGTMEEMDLTDSVWRNGSKPEEIEKVIREGVKGTGMRPITGDPTDDDIKALVKYILKFSADAPPPAPAPAAEPAKPPTPPPPAARNI